MTVKCEWCTCPFIQQSPVKC